MKDEVYDAEYEIVSDKLTPQFIATEKKIEIYNKNSLIKSISLHNKLGYKVRVNVSSDRKYFAVSQTVASDGKAAKLRKYEVYNYNGDLVWEKQTDHFYFVEQYKKENEK